MFSFLQILFNILPRADAAAVWTMEVCFLLLVSDKNPRAVSGFTIPEAADDRGTSYPIMKVNFLFAMVNYAQLPPVKIPNETRFPKNYSAFLPVFTT